MVEAMQPRANWRVQLFEAGGFNPYIWGFASNNARKSPSGFARLRNHFDCMRTMLRLAACAVFLTFFLADAQSAVVPVGSDAGVSQVFVPNGQVCTTSIPPSIEITNHGSVVLNSATIRYGVDGNANQTVIWSGSLNPGEKDTVGLNNVSVSGGAHTFIAYSESPNGTTDDNHANDTTVTSFTATNVLMGLSGFTASCWDASDGLASATVFGGAMPYTYAWSNGGNTSTINNIAPGTYTVTVTEAGGCTTSNSITITSPGQFDIDTDSTETSYPGATDGTATVQVTSGGTAPYTYMWADGQVGSTATGLASGTYCLTITDGNSCDSVACAIVTDPPPCFISLNMSGTNVLCFGDSTGAASVAPGGISPHTYAWSTGDTVASLTNLPAGTYTVTVTDSAYCTGTDSVIVTQPSSLPMATPTGNDPSVPGFSNGSIHASATGGTPGYGYLWYNGVTSPNQGLQGAGTYCLTVTDANGCSDTACVTLVDPPCNMVLGTATSNVQCYSEANGSMAVTVAQGYPPFNFAWSNGVMDSTITGLVAGVYTVTVTDLGNCTATITDTITQPNLIVGSATVTDASCDMANGSATVVASGGTLPYTYTWPTGADSSTVLGLAGGTYTMTISDANGCDDGLIVAVNSTYAPSVTLNAVDATCENANGAVVAGASGGALPYSYQWSSGHSGSVANGLPAGDYILTVTDVNGCTVVDTATIETTINPTINVLLSDASCNSDTGSITLLVNGGAPPYNYNWSNGGDTPSISGLSGGDYSYTVTDFNGCALSDTLTVGMPAPPTVSISNLPESSCTGNDGSATATVTGTAPLSLYWSTNNIGFNVYNLAAGSYTVTVTDGNSCTVVGTTHVSAIGGPIASTNINPVDCPGGMDGTISVTPASGTAPYDIEWSTGDVTNSVTGLPAGQYSVTVTDATSCEATATVILTEPAPFEVDLLITGATQGNSDGQANATVSGGTAPYTYEWPSGGTNPFEFGLAQGTYVLTITDALNCIHEETVHIPLRVTCPVVTVSTVPTDCDNPTGRATANVSGGSTPYTYDWSTGASTATVINLAAGVYFVTVVDAFGCDTVLAATVTENFKPFVTSAVTPSTCSKANGGVNITVSQGLAPYTYNWSNGAVTASLTDLAPNTYTLTVADDNGCTTETTFNIVSATTAPDVNVSKINTVCGDSTGSASATVAGGVPPYSFQWSNGSTASFQNQLPAAIYVVTVTDGNNCTASGTAFVNDIGPGQLSVSSTAIECYGEQNGSATASFANATLAGYLWSNGDTTATADSLLAGVYFVTATDNNGCQYGRSVTVNEPDSITLQVSATDGQCAQNTGTVEAHVTGGTPNYAYVWSNGVSATNQINLAGGTYTCTLTDANGCMAVDEAVVTVPQLPVLNMVGTNETCMQQNGGLTVAVSGAAAPFFYHWSDGTTANAISGIAAGSYSVTVSTAAGCEATTVGSLANVGGITTNISPDQTICLGTNTNLIANGGTGYQWSTGETTAEITVLPGITSTYTVTISDNNGCTQEESVTVTVNPVPVASIVLTNDTICPGDEVTLTASGGVTYEWNNGVNDTSIVVNPYQTTSYVVVPYIGDCPGSPVSASVFMNPLAPVAIASATTVNTYIDEGGEIEFSSVGSIAAFVQWDFTGNGVFDTTDPHPVYSYLEVGQYNAILAATLDGCTTYDTLVIAVIADVSVADAQLSANQVRIYPNPTEGMVTLDLSGVRGTDVRFDVYNALGVRVSAAQVGADASRTVPVDLSGLAAGVYFARVTVDGVSVVKRITKGR